MWFSRWNSYVAEASYLRTIIIAALVTTTLEWTGLAHDKEQGVRFWKSWVTKKIVITNLNRFYRRRWDYPHLPYSGKGQIKVVNIEVMA